MLRFTFSCKLDCIMYMRLTFSCKLDYIMSIAKTASKKIGALICSMNCLSPEVALYLHKSTIRPFMKYFCLVWAGCYAGCHVVMSGAPISYLKLLDKLQKWICRFVGPSLAASLKPLVHSRNKASLNLSIGITLVHIHWKRLNWFHFLILKKGLLVIVIDCMVFVSFFCTIPRCYKDVYANSFFPCTARLWKSAYRMLSFNL